MLITTAGLVAILSYLAVALGLAVESASAVQTHRPAGRWLWLLGLGLAAHALASWSTTFTPQGFNLSVVSAASLVGWSMNALLLLLLPSRPLSSLAAMVLPLVAVALGLDLAVPASHVLAERLPAGLKIHIALALLAYSLFAIATMQAMLLWFAERKLRQHHPIMYFLPPLATMEAVMFQLTLIAFVLLTLSLGLGALHIENIRSQHLAHKIVFSLLAWTVFAILVAGRWLRGWRGRHGVKYIGAGFTLLALAYFGTKFVLEVLLHRV